MKIRLHGTEQECREAAERLREVVGVLAVSEPYPDRGRSLLVRVYVEARLGRLDGAACPEGCGCRLGTDDADRRECGCDGPCTRDEPPAPAPGRES